MAGEAVTHAVEAAAHGGGVDLTQVVVLLAAGVIAVPLFKRLGLGSVLGYLVAGLLVGPFGLGLVQDATAILHAAELGVVLFLFIVGLEMEPTKLWSLRKQIFGLGVIQVVSAGALLTGVGILLGFSPVVAFVAGMGFVLTSTAIVMQILAERGELATIQGQKIVSILLLEDLAIVPLLAVVALLSPAHGEGGDALSRWISVGVAAGSVVAVVFAGRWVLNPVFRFLADAKAREVMTAAALLVVLGAALIMQVGGLSMAMGAFLAGVLLSTSTFKHQLEADVEPFRGILLGLFFLAVGMSLDLGVVAQNWQIIALSVVAYMLVKGAAIYAVARILKAPHAMALERAVLMAQGGEFAFVLYTTAVAAGILDGPQNAIFTATVIVSMIVTPFSLIGLRWLLPKQEQSMDGVEEPDGLTGNVLVIGFGRFGQIASQPLLAKGHKVSIIDNDTEMIRVAGQFGMKVYYGDGTRLDILRAAGAGSADAVLVTVDKKDAANRIVELLKSEFPLVKVFVRAFDRVHALELVKLGVDYQMRELFESALVFGRETVMQLGASAEEADEVIEGVRERDRMRFELQSLDNLQAARDLLLSNAEDQAKEVGRRPAAPSVPIVAEPEPTGRL
ncbi:MAG TPA: monovalent cation:proton antiporter-2 (CPA2) family protein [Devosia sp.]